MTYEELMEMLRDMILQNEIGAIGRRNNNGADSYWCPSCYADVQIQGYCSSTTHLIAIPNHKPDCRIVKLWNLTNEHFDKVD